MLVARNRTPATVTSKSARARSMARAASWKRPPNVSGRETLVTPSPSGGGQRQTTHHVPAKQQEERDRRQGREQRSSENERRSAVRELSLQSGQAGSDRPHPIRRGEDETEEEIVPNPRELKEKEDRDRTPRQRHDDAPEDAEVAAAVDACRFLKFSWDGCEVTPHHKETEREGNRCVEEDHPELGVVEPGI